MIAFAGLRCSRDANALATERPRRASRWRGSSCPEAAVRAVPARLLLLCLLQEFVANGGGRPSGRRRRSAASPGRTGSRGCAGRRGWWRSKPLCRSATHTLLLRANCLPRPCKRSSTAVPAPTSMRASRRLAPIIAQLLNRATAARASDVFRSAKPSSTSDQRPYCRQRHAR
jgi:hypothetical protein